jgi:hypothetical protein
MKITTKFLIFCLSAINVLSACKKDKVTATHPTNGNGVYSMAFAENNIKVSFNSCFITQSYVNNGAQLLVLAYNTTNNKISDNSFEVDLIANIDSIKVGQVFPAASTFLQPKSMGLYFSPDTVNTYTTQPSKPVGSVTITEITATEVKGTFSGNLFDELDFDGNNLLYTITNGTFTAKRE